MNEQGIYNVLTKLDLGIISTLDEWVMAPCPYATWRHASGYDHTGTNFGVHIEDDGISRYNCFSCHSTGTLSGLAFTLATLRDEPELRTLAKKLEKDEILGGELDFGEWEQRKPVAKKQKTIPTNFPSEREFTDKFPSILRSAVALRYIGHRGISLDTAFAIGLRYDPRDYRILFPIYDERSGRFAGCSGRSHRSAAWREAREVATGRKQPKVRDYFGLQKDRLLLGRPQLRVGESHERAAKHEPLIQRERGPLIIVEGLFAYARIRQIRPRLHVRALLGSKLTEGKAALLKMVDRPIYWLTDDDLAGRQCLYGAYDNVSETYNPDDDPRKRGALDILYGDVAQFTMTYPEGVHDPDFLTGEQLDRMMDEAELYIR